MFFMVCWVSVLPPWLMRPDVTATDSARASPR